MGYVLAIEPQQDQASILRDLVGTRTRTKLTVVDSMDAAMTAIDDEVPHLVLLSALIPPCHESELVARLRDLPQATAPQVLFIPALARTETRPLSRTLIDRLLNRNVRPPTGCSPSAFADQLSAYLRELRPAEPFATVTPTPGGDGAERRAAARLERVEWATLLIDGVAVDVVDLSLTGAQIVSSMVMQPGGSVQVVLSSGADAIRCGAGVVWSGFEIIGSTRAASVRAGITFNGAGRSALERLYLDQSQPRHSRRPRAEGNGERGIEASVGNGDGQTTATAPQGGSSIMRLPVDRRRPRADRQERGDVPWLSTVALPWNLDARLLNISNTGLLLESGSKVTPGSVAELKLCGPEWQIAVQACFVRSEVAVVSGVGVKYHTAAAFEKRLDFPGPHPISHETLCLPATTSSDPVTENKVRRAELRKRAR